MFKKFSIALRSLSFKKRVIILLLLLIVTGLFLLWCSFHASAAAKDFQARQNVIAYKLLNSEWTADSSMVYVALKDSSGQYFLGKKKGLNGEYTVIGKSKVKSELDYLYGQEQKFWNMQYASIFALVFIAISICTLIAGVLIRMIFRNAMRGG